MEITEKIYQHIKVMPVEMANQVMDFIQFLELKNQNLLSKDIEETLYILNNPLLMRQIEKSQETYKNGTGHVVDIIE
ncbi:MAG: hypothetical protein KAH84_11775 [Thiomargarita sp.]|nr:hypothetical protein [Thiomargarita sp.]